MPPFSHLESEDNENELTCVACYLLYMLTLSVVVTVDGAPNLGPIPSPTTTKGKVCRRLAKLCYQG